MENCLILVMLFPLLSFVIIGCFGRFLGVYGSMVLSVINICNALLFSVLLFIKISFDSAVYLELWNWVSVGEFSIPFSFRYDGLTSAMFLVVTTVSSCVHLYSCVYMYTDPFLTRFLSYLSLFTFFMLILVSSSNLLVLFLGWEGVGLCSYLLIGFWYTRAQAGKASTKAFLINKVGDLFLLSGISLVFMSFHSVDFGVISALVAYFPADALEVIACFLLVGAVGKSAQVGLHTWLPDAMEGPTPVSALIHAATMVTAGVFLLIRCSILLEYTPRILLLIAVWGGVTALISGTIGVVQNDIKKIIAYSTCSQLGYMVLSCGLSAYSASLFHLLNHAFFKALLFLSAGSIIHILSGEQDIRRMGGLAKLSPFVYISIFLASLALAGFPFFAGFYSKDFIIETAATKFWLGGQLIYWLTVTSALLTAIYSFRLLEQVFWADYSGFKSIIGGHAKVTGVEILVLALLALLSLSTGYFFRDIFLGFGSAYFGQFIHNLPGTHVSIEPEFLPLGIKALPSMLTVLAFEIESRFFECKWFYNEVINGYVALPILVVSRHLFEQYEKVALEQNGPLFMANLVSRATAEYFKK
jgi:NADH-ubiquinone oxidoreductase chain 5